MTDKDFLSSFTDAVTSSNLPELKRLQENGSSSQRQTAVEMKEFWCAQHASTEGHLEVLKAVYNSWCNSDQKKILLSFKNFVCFRLAVSKFKLDIMEQLMFWCDSVNQQAMLSADDFWCFRFAADHGKLDIMKKCFEWANDANRSAMIRAKDYSACVSSSKSGNVEIIKQCLAWASTATINLVGSIIESNEYACFMSAAKCKL